MPPLTTRRLQAELMDQPGLDPHEHDRALTALGRANAISRTSASIWTVVRRLPARDYRDRLRVLDVACGGGHVAIELARRAFRAGWPMEVVGCDISPLAIDYATSEAARSGVPNVRFIHVNALRDPLPGGFDVVLCTLFLHHLTNDDAVTMLNRMRDAARCLVIVSDLRRSLPGYAYAWVGCRVLSRSRVFHVDGIRSVEGAFTTEEARGLAARAGLAGAELGKRWPQRWMLTWKRP